ncbi:hypothetical protein B9N43_15235 [Denitratisoma sp. DHT3]|uniref:hypothetical protein n=1 Tax=Denitratisoma sp. DHT3 TaxID=1981880 RepID=UPI0011984158|nr:hypothetical protein [Denitratisoma sp. DHT3]QDX82470.1 hypothetical protein B9N43_15235 [Denitratisoma sp. DHT3]
MKKNHVAQVILATAIGTLGASAQAVDFKLSGFGTIGGAMTNTDSVAYSTDTNVPGGARKDFEFIDNKVAVQGDLIVDDKLSFTAQIMSKRGYDNSYRPKVEWGYAKYKFTPNLYVRAGRMYAGSFMNTDFAFVGYANLLVRQPVGVYGPRATPGPNDGIDVTWKTNSGDTVYTVSGGTAVTRLHSYTGGGSKSDDLRWLIGSAENGPWMGRISYTEGTLAINHLEANALIGFIGNFDPAYANFMRNDIRRIPYSFTGLGGTYDDGTWQVQAEWTKLKFDSALMTSANNTGWYVTAGRRIGNFTPYASYLRNKKDGSSAPIAPASLAAIPGYGPILAGGVNAFTAADQSQKSVSLGVRWDFMKNTALKFQYDRVITSPSDGFFFEGRTGQYPAGFNKSANVVSAALDFVF